MKNYFLAPLLYFLTFSVYALSYDTYDLNVLIRNFGSDNCYLVNKTLAQGSLIESDFASILAATGERYRFTLRGSVSDAVISYRCGDYKKFTLKMGQYHKRRHNHMTINAEMLDAVDVFEKHQKKPSRHNGGDIHTSHLEFEISQ